MKKAHQVTNSTSGGGGGVREQLFPAECYTNFFKKKREKYALTYGYEVNDFGDIVSLKTALNVRVFFDYADAKSA